MGSSSPVWPGWLRAPCRWLVSLVCLGALGAIAARAGGARAAVGSARVAFWGALAMAVTAGVGKLFGATAG